MSRRAWRRRRRALAAVGLCLLVTLAGCGGADDSGFSAPGSTTGPGSDGPGSDGSGGGGAESPSELPFPASVPADVTVYRPPVPGGGALVLQPSRPTGRVVLYVHGAGEDETSLVTDEEKQALVGGLLDAGYTVAAAAAHGNAWGDPESFASYLDLLDRLRPRAGLFVLAQSMGGLVGMKLPDLVPDVAAVAAIYPLCDLSSLTSTAAEPVIEEAYGSRAALDAALPSLSPSLARHVRGIDVHVWASPDDTVVPAEENGFACTRLARERGAHVQLTRTEGDHGDLSNFDADAVVKLFDGAATSSR